MMLPRKNTTSSCDVSNSSRVNTIQQQTTLLPGTSARESADTKKTSGVKKASSCSTQTYVDAAGTLVTPPAEKAAKAVSAAAADAADAADAAADISPAAAEAFSDSVRDVWWKLVGEIDQLQDAGLFSCMLCPSEMDEDIRQLKLQKRQIRAKLRAKYAAAGLREGARVRMLDNGTVLKLNNDATDVCLDDCVHKINAQPGVVRSDTTTYLHIRWDSGNGNKFCACEVAQACIDHSLRIIQ